MRIIWDCVCVSIQGLKIVSDRYIQRLDKRKYVSLTLFSRDLF
jgi:hypothetical protein